jgi:hypothetical protein
MADDRATPPAAISAGDDARASQAVPPPPPGKERYGPLALARTRKDDGRALLLYSVVGRERA